MGSAGQSGNFTADIMELIRLFVELVKYRKVFYGRLEDIAGRCEEDITFLPPNL